MIYTLIKIVPLQFLQDTEISAPLIISNSITRRFDRKLFVRKKDWR